MLEKLGGRCELGLCRRAMLKPPPPALSALVIEMVYYNLRFALIFDEEPLQ